MCTLGFQASKPDCMKPDPVPGATKSKKKPKKRKSKKSSANCDPDWLPDVEQV